MDVQEAGGRLPTRAAHACDAVLRLHAQLHPVLHGYPIDELLADGLRCPQGLGDADTLRHQQLLLRLLQQWAEQLWREMARLPPADRELVRMVRRRMASERQALLQLHDAIESLPTSAPPAAGG